MKLADFLKKLKFTRKHTSSKGHKKRSHSSKKKHSRHSKPKTRRHFKSRIRKFLFGKGPDDPTGAPTDAPSTDAPEETTA